MKKLLVAVAVIALFSFTVGCEKKGAEPAVEEQINVVEQAKPAAEQPAPPAAPAEQPAPPAGAPAQPQGN
jgi:type IV secretory pathway VirB10-like protein